MPTPPNLSRISNYQVRTGADMRGLIEYVAIAIGDELGLPTRSPIPDDARDNLNTIEDNVKTLTDPKEIAPYFGLLRDAAKQAGAPQTADAVVSSAKWFWCNVEDPAACQAASRSTGLVSTGGGTPSYARQTLLTKKQKQMVLYVGVPVLLTGIGLYFILRD